MTRIAISTDDELMPRPAFPDAPTSFQQKFPVGTFHVCGIIVDPNSPNAKPVSLTNSVIVESR